MMFTLAIAVITIIILAIASYTDIKTREVPDWISYALIFIALGFAIIFSFIEGWFVLVSSLFGFGIAVALGFLLYYTQQWGGADSKLLMGMGAVIGIAFPFSVKSFDLLWYFLLILFIGTIYGLFWMGYLAVKKHQHFRPMFKQKFKEHKRLLIPIIVLKIVFTLLTFLYPPAWPFIPVPLAVFLLFLFVNSVEHSCFRKTVSPKVLTEGDWLAQPIHIKGKPFLPKKTLTKKDIQQIQRKRIHSVIIKEGIPFVPAFFLAYCVLLIVQYFNIFFLGWL